MRLIKHLYWLSCIFQESVVNNWTELSPIFLSTNKSLILKVQSQNHQALWTLSINCNYSFAPGTAPMNRIFLFAIFSWQMRNAWSFIQMENSVILGKGEGKKKPVSSKNLSLGRILRWCTLFALYLKCNRHRLATPNFHTKLDSHHNYPYSSFSNCPVTHSHTLTHLFTHSLTSGF